MATYFEASPGYKAHKTRPQATAKNKSKFSKKNIVSYQSQSPFVSTYKLSFQYLTGCLSIR